jgi:hypothetical protein
MFEAAVYSPHGKEAYEEVSKRTRHGPHVESVQGVRQDAGRVGVCNGLPARNGAHVVLAVLVADGGSTLLDGSPVLSGTTNFDGNTCRRKDRPEVIVCRELKRVQWRTEW